ncbi:Cytochrome c-type biogenesis protein CcmB [Serratia marcescens]|uniref:Cytochrome c-type biogenesis protein CcmB n=1 Tax=Serratia marcescens TaxID=615 RepID=A0A379Z0D1_SERMA|nr:Cytochrome c-type biogenesis protein CcmB [Serratia marcescens]
MLLPTPLPMTVLGKVCAHWVVTGLPLLILSPLVALLLSLDMQTWLAVAGTLLLGTPTLSLIGAIGVGLTVGLRKGGVLLSLLVLPLYIPVADLRHRRDRRRRDGHADRRLPGDTRRDAGGQRDIGAVCRRSGAASERGTS